MVGYFDYNSGRAFANLLPDPAPKIGISLRQAIAINFIAEALGQSESLPAVSRARTSPRRLTTSRNSCRQPDMRDSHRRS